MSAITYKATNYIYCRWPTLFTHTHVLYTNLRSFSVDCRRDQKSAVPTRRYAVQRFEKNRRLRVDRNVGIEFLLSHRFAEAKKSNKGFRSELLNVKGSVQKYFGSIIENSLINEFNE